MQPYIYDHHQATEQAPTPQVSPAPLSLVPSSPQTQPLATTGMFSVIVFFSYFQNVM